MDFKQIIKEMLQRKKSITLMHLFKLEVEVELIKITLERMEKDEGCEASILVISDTDIGELYEELRPHIAIGCDDCNDTLREAYNRAAECFDRDEIECAVKANNFFRELDKALLSTALEMCSQ